MTTDTEEDETVDFLLKSAMTTPKGQPPKKRTKKYGERKSCKLKKMKHFSQVRFTIWSSFMFKSDELETSMKKTPKPFSQAKLMTHRALTITYHQN